jgi:hypothetical protein
MMQLQEMSRLSVRAGVNNRNLRWASLNTSSRLVDTEITADSEKTFVRRLNCRRFHLHRDSHDFLRLFVHSLLHITHTMACGGEGGGISPLATHISRTVQCVSIKSGVATVSFNHPFIYEPRGSNPGGSKIYRTQPPLQWIQGVSFSGVKRPWRVINHHPHLAPRLKKE